MRCVLSSFSIGRPCNSAVRLDLLWKITRASLNQEGPQVMSKAKRSLQFCTSDEEKLPRVGCKGWLGTRRHQGNSSKGIGWLSARGGSPRSAKAKLAKQRQALDFGSSLDPLLNSRCRHYDRDCTHPIRPPVITMHPSCLIRSANLEALDDSRLHTRGEDGLEPLYTDLSSPVES